MEEDRGYGLRSQVHRASVSGRDHHTGRMVQEKERSFSLASQAGTARMAGRDVERGGGGEGERAFGMLRSPTPQEKALKNELQHEAMLEQQGIGERKFSLVEQVNDVASEKNRQESSGGRHLPDDANFGLASQVRTAARTPPPPTFSSPPPPPPPPPPLVSPIRGPMHYPSPPIHRPTPPLRQGDEYGLRSQVTNLKQPHQHHHTTRPTTIGYVSKKSEPLGPYHGYYGSAPSPPAKSVSIDRNKPKRKTTAIMVDSEDTSSSKSELSLRRMVVAILVFFAGCGAVQCAIFAPLPYGQRACSSDLMSGRGRICSVVPQLFFLVGTCTASLALAALSSWLMYRGYKAGGDGRAWVLYRLIVFIGFAGGALSVYYAYVGDYDFSSVETCLSEDYGLSFARGRFCSNIFLVWYYIGVIAPGLVTFIATRVLLGSSGEKKASRAIIPSSTVGDASTTPHKTKSKTATSKKAAQNNEKTNWSSIESKVKRVIDEKGMKMEPIYGRDGATIAGYAATPPRMGYTGYMEKVNRAYATIAAYEGSVNNKVTPSRRGANTEQAHILRPPTLRNDGFMVYGNPSIYEERAPPPITTFQSPAQNNLKPTGMVQSNLLHAGMSPAIHDYDVLDGTRMRGYAYQPHQQPGRSAQKMMMTSSNQLYEDTGSYELAAQAQAAATRPQTHPHDMMTTGEPIMSQQRPEEEFGLAAQTATRHDTMIASEHMPQVPEQEEFGLAAQTVRPPQSQMTPMTSGDPASQQFGLAAQTQMAMPSRFMEREVNDDGGFGLSAQVRSIQ